jgi:predicted ATPase
VLDNCEHVRDSSAEVVRSLIEACPELTVLATSRESLRVPGEHVFPVPPLGVPPADPDLEIPAIANYEAVRLFVARATSVVDDFRLGPANAAAVADVCRTLDGIPLAIELAAARVRMLSVEEIRGMLTDRFRLVASAGPATVERHQTLRAAIDWSYELLTPAERRMLRALAVFRGGWSLAAATAVSAAADSFATLDLMTRLAEKSLLQLDRVEAGESRYRMLETVRLYADERLEAGGEAVDRHDLHRPTPGAGRSRQAGDLEGHRPRLVARASEHRSRKPAGCGHVDRGQRSACGEGAGARRCPVPVLVHPRAL